MNDQETIRFLHRLYTKFADRNRKARVHSMFPSFIKEFPMWFDIYFSSQNTWRDCKNYVVHGRFGPLKNIPF